MKILFLGTNIGYGGASKVMAQLASYMSKANDVTFLTFRSDELKQPISDRVKHVHNQLSTINIPIIRSIMQIIALHKYLKTNDYDIAVAFLPPSNYMLTLAAKSTDTKVLLSERADPISRNKNGGLLVKILERIIQRADGYVFQSNGARDCYPKRCRDNSVVIPNAITDSGNIISNSDSDEKRIVHVARMELVQKRQDIMLKAFKIFSQKYPQYLLQFYGDGPEEEQVKKMAADMGIDGKIEFLGAQKDILNKISGATMFVLTSDYEGIPNALLEAMSIGLPCITTDCSPGGARMLIEDGENGFIVPCEDYSAIAQRMIDLVEKQEIREKFAKKSIEIVNKFSYDNVYKKWEEFFVKLI